MWCFSEYFGKTSLMIFGFFFVVFIFWWFVMKPLSYWKKKGIPFIPAVPFTGSFPMCFWKSNMVDVFARMYRQLDGKRYGGFHKMSKPSILIRDPELIRDILENNFDSFHDNDFGPETMVESVFEKNLAFLKGDAWEKLRVNIAPAFSSIHTRKFVPLILEVCETLEDCVSTRVDSILELKEIGQCYMTDVISTIALGTRGDSLLNPGGKFRRMGRRISNTSLLHFLAMKLLMGVPGLQRILPFFRFSPKAVEFFRSVVSEAIKIREEEKVKRPDFLHMLVELQKDGKLGPKDEASPEETADDNKGENKVWSDEALNNVTIQALSFFVNGMNATSNIISFSLLELAHNTEIQDKARAEIVKVLECHGSISLEAMQDMPFLETVILETVRKYPPYGFLTRSTTKRYLLPRPEFEEEDEDKSEGLWLEEGSSIIIPVLGIHMDPQYYSNPEIFDPDNFSDKSIGKRSRFCFLGFGKGPRTCIGMKIGVVQVKAALATLLAKYEFLPCEKTPLPITLDPFNLSTTAKGGLWVKVTSLKKRS